MRRAIPTGILLLALPLLRAWIRSASFIAWDTIEAALAPKLEDAGCRNLELSADGPFARLSVDKRVLGAWLPVELSILPLGLEVDERFRLGLSLREARLMRPSGVRAWCVLWLARIGLVCKRTSVRRLILDALAEQPEIDVEGDAAWFVLDAVPPFSKLQEIRERFPATKALPLGQFATCRGIHPREDGVQFDIQAGPLVRGARDVVAPWMGAFPPRNRFYT